MTSFVGDRGRYRLDPAPLGEGGYAKVFRATVKDSGAVVAFKKAKNGFADGGVRLRREVRAMVDLADHPNVMNVLDADDTHRWYVMPLAEGDLDAFREAMAPERLVDALSQVAAALGAAHDLGLVHRDVTPKNILAFDGRSRWVVADWGLVRGPRGATTRKLTRTGVVLGTEGFIAPEVLRDAHREASPAADVYSLGRVAAWAVTGKWPLAGELLLPNGPWRRLVRDATRSDAAARPSLDTFISDMREVTYQSPGQLGDRAAQLAGAAHDDERAGAELLDLADAHPDDATLFFDHLPKVRGTALDRLVDDPPHAERLSEAMRSHLCDSSATWGTRNFDAANAPLNWLRALAQAAEGRDQLGVLEDAAAALFAAGAHWRRFPERRETRQWLEQLAAEAAQTVARALRRDDGARAWLLEESWRPDPGAHPAIRDALGL